MYAIYALLNIGLSRDTACKCIRCTITLSVFWFRLGSGLGSFFRITIVMHFVFIASVNSVFRNCTSIGMHNYNVSINNLWLYVAWPAWPSSICSRSVWRCLCHRLVTSRLIRVDIKTCRVDSDWCSLQVGWRVGGCAQVGWFSRVSGGLLYKYMLVLCALLTTVAVDALMC